MRRALALARRGFGQVSPNPAVGAVVVKEGRIVGEGYHVFDKTAHAESLSLESAGKEAKGATIYVNLEPCCHVGRTPPCAGALLQAGVERAVIAIRDPDPRVSGRGVEKLASNGVEVVEGVCAEEATRLNETFLHYQRFKTPFVLLKLAQTLDGKIATRIGDSKWVTGQSARQEGHRLRYGYDSILVGVGTVLSDDPSLDVRWKKRNSITKVLLDSDLRTPPSARVFLSGDPVIIFHRMNARSPSAYSQNTRLIAVPSQKEGLSWPHVLTQLGNFGIQSVMIEGGRSVATSALKQRVVQKLCLFLAPRIVGEDGLSGFGLLETELLGDAIELQRWQSRAVGSDLMIEAYLTGPSLNHPISIIK